MTEKQGYSSVAALVMARAQRQLAEKYQDGELATNAQELEKRALGAIKLGQSELEPYLQRNRKLLMADDVAPYAGAIEETAKTAGKALDLIKDASGPIADFYSLVIGDRVQAARHRRLDEMTRRTRKILRDRNLSET